MKNIIKNIDVNAAMAEISVSVTETETIAPVAFVSYTGKYPNLCNGILTLLIEGKMTTFGRTTAPCDYARFWRSGGECYFDSNYRDHVSEGAWVIDADSLPDDYKKYHRDIERIFNENVPRGCCGGCI